jgi:hypothetical protein
LVLLALVLGTHVCKLYSASTLVLFLSASCSWDGGSRASAQLSLNVHLTCTRVCRSEQSDERCVGVLRSGLRPCCSGKQNGKPHTIYFVIFTLSHFVKLHYTVLYWIKSGPIYQRSSTPTSLTSRERQERIVILLYHNMITCFMRTLGEHVS